MNRKKYYMGNVFTHNLNCGEIDNTFLRNINTKDYFGYIYGFQIKNECILNYNQIIDKLDG